MASERYLDLMKQGFMKPRREKREPAKPKPTVACEECLNWHAEGKHTAPIDVRRARRLEKKATMKTCNFSSFIRSSKHHGHADRQYTAVGVMVAKWVMKRRSKKFNTEDLKIKRGTGLAPHVVQAWANEFLASWKTGEDSSHSLLANRLLQQCPQLHDRVKKYWEGY